MATQNPYSDSLLADAFRGSLSNLESLGRGFAVAPVGLLGDVNALAREYITPRLPSSVQGLLQQMPAAPTTERILSNIPRVSAPRMETAGMEQLGAAMNPRGPVDLARGAGRLAGSAVNEAMVYGRGPLAAITPQPMKVLAYHGTNAQDILMPKSSLENMYDRTGFTGWFSESPELANYYSLARGIEGGAVIPVDIKMKKPLKLNFDMNDSPEEAMKIAEKLGLDRDFFPNIFSDKNTRAFEVVNDRHFKQAALEAGYDSIQVPEEGVMTFAPLIENGKQVKSVFDLKQKGLLD